MFSILDREAVRFANALDIYRSATGLYGTTRRTFPPAEPPRV
jgi:hypothetical protein